MVLRDTQAVTNWVRRYGGLRESRRAMRFLNRFVVLICIAQALCAQPSSVLSQEAEHARRLLNSTDWATKAWGAYIAGHLRLDALHRPLLEQFSAAAALEDAEFDSPEYAWVAALFDASIEGGFEIPAALLEPYEQHWADEVLIMLARLRRDPSAEDALLRIRARKSRDAVWLAANNILLQRRSLRWYAALLSEITVTHRFTVISPGSSLAPESRAGYGPAMHDWIIQMAQGFPPVTRYRVEISPREEGSVMLAEGPQDTYYLRFLVTNGHGGGGWGTPVFDRTATRIGYLAHLGGERTEQTIRLFQSQTEILYTGTEEFDREVERSMSAQEQGIRTLIQKLERWRMRAPDMHLRIVPEVVDKRLSATDSLPGVPERVIELRDGLRGDQHSNSGGTLRAGSPR